MQKRDLSKLRTEELIALRQRLNVERERILTKYKPRRERVLQGQVPKAATRNVDRDLSNLDSECRRRFKRGDRDAFFYEAISVLKSNRANRNKKSQEVMFDARKKKTRKEVADLYATAREITLPNPANVPSPQGRYESELQNDRKLFVSDILKRKGWSISDLANESKLDVHTVYDYVENKRRSYPFTRQKLARALGIEPQNLPQ